MSRNSTNVVEHIRRVHFSLLLACFALAASLTVRLGGSTVERALEDLQQIARLQNSGRVWIRPYLESLLADLPELPSTGHLPVVKSLLLSNGVLVPLVSISNGPRFWSYLLHPEKGTYTKAERRSAILDVESWSSLEGKPPLEISTLSTFREVWDSDATHLHVPEALGARRSNGALLELEYRSIRQEGSFKAPQHLSCRSAPSVERISDRVARTDLCLESSIREPSIVTISWRAWRVDPRKALNLYLDTEWPGRPFEGVFPELGDHSKGLEALPLDGLATLLRAEQKKLEEQVQIFGASLPASSLSSWGGLIIVCVQLYLLLHMRVLSIRMSRDDPGWDTPWIGLYRGFLSRSATLFSVAIVPVLTLVFIASRHSFFIWLSLVPSLGLSAGAIFVLRRLWQLQVEMNPGAKREDSI